MRFANLIRFQFLQMSQVILKMYRQFTGKNLSYFDLNRDLQTLWKKSQKRIYENKASMETIIDSSSKMLSKKIQAFEKKYVNHYLKNMSKLSDCEATLEELQKRSSKFLTGEKLIIFCRCN